MKIRLVIFILSSATAYENGVCLLHKVGGGKMESMKVRLMVDLFLLGWIDERGAGERNAHSFYMRC
jgi:hypothetical protein